jgi:LysM repeat protein
MMISASLKHVNGITQGTYDESQKEEKIVIVEGKKYRVYHVQKGDSWYNIAKKYGTTYVELRVANKNTDDKLEIGKELLIPTEEIKADDPFYDKNYIDSTSNKQNEIKYHIVKKSETLYSIAKMHGIKVDNLKKWNNLRSNNISIGQKLIVSEMPLKNFNQTKNLNDEPIRILEPDEIKETQKKAPNVKPEIKNEKTEIPKETQAKNPATKTSSKNAKEEMVNPAGNGKIVFASNRRKIEEAGFAVVTEAYSGEEKYFALHRNAPIGTIIRVTNVSNSKEIYVKVTGTLEDEPDDDEVIISISKTSAENLEATDKKFKVELLYGIDKD